MQTAMAQGLPITCASCCHLATPEHALWRCNRLDTCGGPLSGRDFPDYDGVISRDRFQERCLCCGGENLSHTMIVPGTTTRFGLCALHAPIFEQTKTIEGHTTDRIIQRPVLIALPK
jgi:hypothetical protein